MTTVSAIVNGAKRTARKAASAVADAAKAAHKKATGTGKGAAPKVEEDIFELGPTKKIEKGFFGRVKIFFVKVRDGIKKAFTAVKNFFKRIFSKETAAKVKETINNAKEKVKDVFSKEVPKDKTEFAYNLDETRPKVDFKHLVDKVKITTKPARAEGVSNAEYKKMVEEHIAAKKANLAESVEKTMDNLNGFKSIGTPAETNAYKKEAIVSRDLYKFDESLKTRKAELAEMKEEMIDKFLGEKYANVKN
jgi:hypothetical protein